MFANVECKKRRTMKFVKIKEPSIDIDLNSYDFLHSVINSCSNQITEAWEQQIINKLEDNGYKFETRQELEEFAKTRCNLEHHPNKLRRLTVDGLIICEWWDTLEITEKDGKYTSIKGNPPSSWL